MLLKAAKAKIDALVARIGPHHRRIASDMILIGLFILGARLAGAFKEMAVAWRFGAGHLVDAYLLVLNFVTIAGSVWYSVIHATLTPLLVGLRGENAEEEKRFRSELLGATALFGLLAGFLTWSVLHVLFLATDLGLPPETYALARGSVPYLVFLVPLTFIIHLGAVFMMTRGQHANTLLEASTAVVLFLALVGWAAGGIKLLLWATLAGSALHLTLTLWVLSRERLLTRPILAFTSPGWSRFRSVVGLVLLAQLLFATVTVVDQLFAAPLGEGAISSFGYAARILALFLALGATTIARATLPVYSRIRAEAPERLGRIAVQWTMLLFLAGCLVAGLGWATSEWIVRLLFERGAFTHENTLEVARILRWGFPQLPVYFAMIAVSQGLFSANRYGLAAGLAAISLITKAALSALLVPRFGIPALMLSTAAMYAVYCLTLVILSGRMPRLRNGGGHLGANQ